MIKNGQNGRGCMQEFIARLLVPRSTLNHVSSLTYDVIFEPLHSPAASKFDIFIRKWIDCYYNFWQTILLTIHFYVSWDADFEFDIKNQIRKIQHVQFKNLNLAHFELFLHFCGYMVMETGKNKPRM